MKNFKPHGDRILVEPIRGNDEIVGAIHIPEAHREKQLSIEGIVAGLGTGIRVDVKVGDRVIMERYRGTDVQIGQRMFKLVASNELLAIIE